MSQILVECRLCGQIVPGIASGSGILAAIHNQPDNETRCPGSNCPTKNSEPKKQTLTA